MEKKIKETKTIQVYFIDGHRGMGKSTIVNTISKELEDYAQFEKIETGVFYAHCKTIKKTMNPNFRKKVKRDTEHVINYFLKSIAANINDYGCGVLFVLGRDAALCEVKVKIPGVKIERYNYVIKANYTNYKKINLTNPKFSDYRKRWEADETLIRKNFQVYNSHGWIEKISDNVKLYKVIRHQLGKMGLPKWV